MSHVFLHSDPVSRNLLQPLKHIYLVEQELFLRFAHFYSAVFIELGTAIAHQLKL